MLLHFFSLQVPVALDTGIEPRIAEACCSVLAIQFRKQIEGILIRVGSNKASFGRRCQVWHRWCARGVQNRSLMRNGKETGSEISFLVVRQPAGIRKNDKRGQVFRKGAQDRKRATRRIQGKPGRINPVFIM